MQRNRREENQLWLSLPPSACLDRTVEISDGFRVELDLECPSTSEKLSIREFARKKEKSIGSSILVAVRSRKSIKHFIRFCVIGKALCLDYTSSAWSRKLKNSEIKIFFFSREFLIRINFVFSLNLQAVSEMR